MVVDQQVEQRDTSLAIYDCIWVPTITCEYVSAYTDDIVLDDTEMLDYLLHFGIPGNDYTN